ncbi:hypothetical protein MOKP37_05830 [Mycobacterium avium subsp. hominissuis]
MPKVPPDVTVRLMPSPRFTGAVRVLKLSTALSADDPDDDEEEPEDPAPERVCS